MGFPIMRWVVVVVSYIMVEIDLIGEWKWGISVVKALEEGEAIGQEDRLQKFRKLLKSLFARF